MAIADSNRGRLAYIVESTFGTTPATPTLQTLRATAFNFDYQKGTTASNEVRSDRMVAALMEVSGQSTGSIDYELSFGGSYDPLIEAALCGTFSTAINATGATATVTTNVLGATGIGTNAVVGQYVLASGFTNPVNNGWHLVSAVSANALTVTSTLATDTGGTVKGKRVRNGTTARSFFFEEGFTDVTQFFGFNGQRIGTFSLDGSAGQVVTGKFGLQGTTSTFGASANGSSYTPATTTTPVNATSNFGTIQEGATLINLATGVQGFSMALDNSLRQQMAVSKKSAYGIGYGKQSITGSLNAYFENTNLYTKFLNHTATGLSFSFTDSGLATGMRVTLPRVYFTESNPSVGGIDQDVMEQLNWTAIADATGTYQIQIDIA